MNKISSNAVNFYLLSLVLCFLSSCSKQEDKTSVLNVAGGDIVRIENFDSRFVDSRHIDIWLPPAYGKGTELGVLYMQDGQSLYDATTTWNEQEWGVDEFFIKYPDLQNYIVVGTWNAGANRWNEYFPSKAFNYMSASSMELLHGHGIDSIEGKFSSDQYLKFLVEELKPFVDSNFEVNNSREYTAIMGSSMGGLISWYATCEYPAVFGTALCLSTHWPGIFTNENNPIPTAFLDYLEDKLDVSEGYRFYFDTGTETLDSLYLVHQSKVDSLFRGKGFSEQNFLSNVIEGAGHTEDYWRARLDLPFNFLMQ